MRKIAPAAISALLIFVMTVFSGCQSTKEAISVNSIEVRNNGEYIQWKNGGDEWHNLVDLNEIISKISGLSGGQNGTDGQNGKDGADGASGKNGADGKSVEIRKSEGYIQWRYEGGSWENLVALSELTGSAGANGLNGKDGADGKDGANGRDGQNGTDGIDGKDGADGKNGADGKDGINGVNGQDIEIRQADSYIQWRYSGGDWQNLVALSDITGPAGANGKDGLNGRDGTDGKDGADGKDGVNGTDGRNGKDGSDGADGKTPEFRTDPETNQLQWRYIGENAWLYLYDLSLLKGKDGVNGINGNDGKNGIDGKQIEVKKTDSHIQWRYEDGDWQDLVALSDITGPAGQNGLNGTNGTNGQDGADGKTPEFRVDSETNQLQWRYVGENTWLYLYDMSSLKGKDGTNGTNGKDGNDGKD